MSLDDRVCLSETSPPTDLPADVRDAWRKLAPLVDASGVVVLPHHLPFAYRAMRERVALHRRWRVRITDAIPWFKPFGVTAAQVREVM